MITPKFVLARSLALAAVVTVVAIAGGCDALDAGATNVQGASPYSVHHVRCYTGGALVYEGDAKEDAVTATQLNSRVWIFTDAKTDQQMVVPQAGCIIDTEFAHGAAVPHPEGHVLHHVHCFSGANSIYEGNAKGEVEPTWARNSFAWKFYDASNGHLMVVPQDACILKTDPSEPAH